MFSEAEKAFLKVGFKQTLKAINENKAEKVYIASDCEERLKDTLKSALENKQTEVFYIDTMRELGKLCEIHIGASCAAVTK